jgi:ADP-ribose pyrophosphatase YjhB (NUDIX family)
LPGEEPAAACVREVAEETGLAVTVVRWAGRVERAAPDGGVYVIDDFVCSLAGGTLQAADDAADARWFDPADLSSIDVVPGLLEALRTWSLLAG